MSFSSINIQGNIVSAEILNKIRSEDKFKHQSPESFGLARTASLRDEVGLAWSIMRTHWQAYKKRLETLPKGDTGTSLTREKLIIPLLSELGYEVNFEKRDLQINGKPYAISHGASNRDNFPIHIMGYNDKLDTRRESGRSKISPHALVQEYLNNTEHLYALVTNGRQLRLLRDATRLVRMSYLEFDLERMFEEELYADFSMLYRLLHVSRMPENMESGADSVIEYYHQESMASGTRIREKLSEAVEDSIKRLANGFLTHPKNTNLTNLFADNKLDADTYYMHQLRLIYRILFVIVLEERNLIYPEELTAEEQRFRDIYYKYYSIERLRKLTENRVYVDADKFDLWESLKTTFYLFESEKYGTKIGIKPLGSGLFHPDALGTLKSQYLSNGDLIEVLKRLTTFITEQGQWVRVNYSDLDVEEFGSVYEGLLEYDPKVEKIGAKWQFSFIEGKGRSTSGSHYTPEELVKPLIKHSLDYIIADKLKEANPQEALLSITVCDVACGSGHILLSAARRIAIELASLREGAEQPSPTYYRAAIRDVIRNCIYGVDLNPLAVELCKVALWLEAHNPNEPLNFLDHRIKNGNAIVGLAHFEELENGIATEAFKTLPGDDKEVAASFRKTNENERKAKTQLTTYDLTKADDSLKSLRKEYAEFSRMPEHTPEEIEAKTNAYKKITQGAKWWRLKSYADVQVAQFFIPKTLENKPVLVTDAMYRKYLNSGSQVQDRGMSLAVASEKHFFHWFLEFPEIFAKGGFDCILGNPPYLGGSKLSGFYGYEFLHYVRFNFFPAKGLSDLVTFFIRNIFNLLREQGFLSIITTNTISQGDTREGGLDVIVKNGGIINFAIKSLKWPGEANLQVTLMSLFKGAYAYRKLLDDRDVSYINTFLTDEVFIGKPMKLRTNEGLSYNGSSILGKGFILSNEEASEFLANKKNESIVKPLFNGSELNSLPELIPNRFVINFYDWDINKAKQYSECFAVLKERVYPERQLQNDKGAKEKWWQFLRPRLELYSKIEKFDLCLAIALTSKTSQFRFVPTKYIYSHAVGLFASNSFNFFAILQSSFHVQWAWKYGSTMKSDLRYTSSDVFENFSFPSQYSSSKSLYVLGKQTHDLRDRIIQLLQCGTTTFFNLFNNPTICLESFQVDDGTKEKAIKEINTYQSILKDLDNLILTLYDWHVDSDKWGKAIDLRHDFYEVDYLPENDRVRYTIHPDARKEVLKRLLLLNHERFEEEVQQGLHKKKEVEAYYKQKNKPVPEGTPFSDVKQKSTKTTNFKPKMEQAKESPNLLGEQDVTNKSGAEVTIKSKVTLKNTATGEQKKVIISASKGGQLSLGYESIQLTSSFAMAMINRKAGSKFKFEGAEFEIMEVL